MISQQTENEAVQEDFVLIFYISCRGFVFINYLGGQRSEGGTYYTNQICNTLLIVIVRFNDTILNKINIRFL